MTESTPVSCLVCRKHRGLLEVPGGAIYEDDQVAQRIRDFLLEENHDNRRKLTK